MIGGPFWAVSETDPLEYFMRYSYRKGYKNLTKICEFGRAAYSFMKVGRLIKRTSLKTEKLTLTSGSAMSEASRRAELRAEPSCI